MISIPERLKGFNFVLLGKIENETGVYDCKAPFEKRWQKLERRFDNPLLIKHLEENKNYGVRGGSTSPIRIGEDIHELIILDFDDELTQTEVLKKIPDTFMVKTGGKGLLHVYLATDKAKSFKVFGEKDTTGKRKTRIDVQGEGKQVVAPNSINDKTGRKYEVVKDVPIAFIHYEELLAIVKPFDLHEQDLKEKPKKQYIPKNTSNELADKVLSSISIYDAFKEVGIDIKGERFDCPVHASTSHRSVKINSDGVTAKCFGCGKSWNAYSLIREVKNLTDRQTWDYFAEKGGLTEELNKSRKEYAKEKNSKSSVIDFSIEALIDKLLDDIPMFYDRARIFWRWNKETCSYEQIDITDLKIAVSDGWKRGFKIDRKYLDLIIERARLRIPENPKPTWVQFNSKIYDFSTGEIIKAIPKYFITNPIPFDLGDSEDTPNIDKLFVEWVGEEHKQTLYQILAYSLTSYKFMQRIIALVGGGSNGKSTFMSLLQNFIGKANYTSSELKLLAERNFETAILYKKLLCIIGEVSYDDLNNTSQIKKLSGEDDIRFEFKGKQPFSDKNSATIVCLTNSLPRTPDKSIGFYRRWLILDFPKQFAIGKNPVQDISKKEYENLAKKCLRILKELYETREFHNEGDYAQREKIYEEKSNPIVLYIDENYEDTPSQHTIWRDFINHFNKWLKNKRQRPLDSRTISRMLQNEGYSISSRQIYDKGQQKMVSNRVVVNLSIKTTETTIIADFQTDFSLRKTKLKNANNGSFGSNVDVLTYNECGERWKT